jgi:Ca2+-binding RTX toxin-like protein
MQCSPARRRRSAAVLPAVAGADNPASWMRWLVTGVCCLVGALILVDLAAPTGALADGAVTRVGAELRYDSDSGDRENLVISRPAQAFECAPVATPCVQFANGPQQIRVSAYSDPGCTVVNNSSQTVVACSPTGVTSVRLSLNDGDDFVTVLDAVPETTLIGAAGSDHLASRSGSDTVLGGPGDDELRDDFDGAGADVLDGGTGNDAIALGAGNDDVIGGPEFDTVTMGSGDDTVRLDGVANDGGVGEAKNIHTDVEAIDGGPGSDKLFGSAAANSLLGGPGNDRITSGGGPDVLDGGSGADDLRGGPGLDRVVYSNSAGQTITLNDVRDDGAPGELDNVHVDVEDVAAGPGDDTVIGSQAANFLDGGEGNDGLEGLGGVDAYFGGPGTDALFARDGLAERVQCGPETDSVDADTTDLLADCENVLLSSAVFQTPTPTNIRPSDYHDRVTAREGRRRGRRTRDTRNLQGGYARSLMLRPAHRSPRRSGRPQRSSSGRSRTPTTSCVRARLSELAPERRRHETGAPRTAGAGAGR